MSNGDPKEWMPQMVMYGVGTIDDGDIYRRMREALNPLQPYTFTTTTQPALKLASADELAALTKRVEALEAAIIRRAAKRKRGRK